MRNRATTPLVKPRLRQSWSKYNLYNLSRVTNPNQLGKTFFQQKWQSKSLLRDYHGEQVREGRWEKMFRRRLQSVVSMDPAYLAENDGSLESAGRGSGLRANDLWVEKKKKAVPYSQMTFAPLERRLDTAIFRAMFASSARQARQFVIHGAVKVNGKKMRHPSYLLNPGDMFQVDPERVLYATGAPKQAIEKPKDTEASGGKDQEETMEVIDNNKESSQSTDEVDIERDPREVLKDLLAQSKSILASPKEKLGARRKQDLRAFSSAVRRLLSRSSSSTVLLASLEAQFEEIKTQLKISRENGMRANTSSLSEMDDTGKGLRENIAKEQTKAVESSTTDLNQITDQEYNQLFAALTQMQENPVDDSKPYATPWTPRDYMSAFAFIPRYLEVNPKVCAAIYLRHPVARPGTAEVPTPFAEQIGRTAYAWYLRRR